MSCQFIVSRLIVKSAHNVSKILTVERVLMKTILCFLDSAATAVADIGDMGEAGGEGWGDSDLIIDEGSFSKHGRKSQ